MQVLTICIDQDLLEKLKEAGRQEERSLSQVVRRLLRTALVGYMATPPPAKLGHSP